ncbi:MAG TPA: DUF4147 domain-containing protein, partial [Longimicrobiales bacterium]|nr:DUF4147 domain-containing protein [Longimicrobiales bacterium]
DVIRAALAAANPEALVAEALEADPPRPDPGGRLLVLAVGKAAPGMLRGAARVLGERARRDLAVVPRGLEAAVPAGARTHGAGHPLPDDAGVAAARQVQATLRGLGSRDRLLLLLSGGGSALLTLPAEPVGLQDLRRVTGALLQAGADIGELNAVRKHLEVLKGGGLARAAAPAPVRALVLSDVVGDRLEVIASGPVSPDSSTFADAMRVLKERGVWEQAPRPVRERLEAGLEGRIAETPDALDDAFRSVDVSVVGNASLAAEAAAKRASALGYAARVESVAVTGEAREVGAELGRLARRLPSATCRVMAGETTVTVRGTGKGGRNQEVVLGAVDGLDGLEDVLVFSVGTDGVDGPTDAAGAWATGRTLSRARAVGMDPSLALEHNDAYPFFGSLDDLVVTGPTGTNVMDVMGVLVGSPPVATRTENPSR